MYTVDDIALQHHTITGLRTRIAELGEGPTVLFVHGWPECWYSWRHQMVALANAGYRTLAPDMPGFAGTDPLPAMEDYNIERISAFLLELIDTRADAPIILVGHDWGASNCWNFTLRHPEAVSKLVTMSVPLAARADRPPMERMRELFGENFFYQLYFQKPGIADAEFDADPHGILSRLYCSPDTPREPPVLGPLASEGGGWIDRLGKPKEMPAWLSEQDLAYYIDTYRSSGFTGGLNYYRNLDRNWELMRPYDDRIITCPVLFLSGSDDSATRKAPREKLEKLMANRVPSLRIRVLPNIGHWIQQEAADDVNQELLDFVRKR
ncbi:hypothetical protein CAI21_18265 [Alkalilimnicola ehrlichii]|uniref:AB hydrolase-1 domain-containing protein n=1 Tax=Alkalilimnicola ehrlichii TaxID=351052 RepID=A0A3E0WSZ0_9GAMM|nr:alpha/beta hydrolase [Alkalilimnicola ehrlichii]RFA25802.1 hypothetical protein CAI21_18265 [Alkalilimnicola ehrlichii]RFA35096.1 hypothetical protein CAL65_13375 [Alkalilimnicola ehrlichii]